MVPDIVKGGGTDAFVRARGGGTEILDRVGGAAEALRSNSDESDASDGAAGRMGGATIDAPVRERGGGMGALAGREGSCVRSPGRRLSDGSAICGGNGG